MKTQNLNKLIMLFTVIALLFSCNNDDDNIVLSNENQLLSFVFKAIDNTALDVDAIAVINEFNHEVTVSVPYGTELNSLTPTISVSNYASVTPNTSEAQDFNSLVTYIVRAEDGTEQTYTVTVTFGASNEAKILSFDFKAADNTDIDVDVTGEIDDTNTSVLLYVAPFYLQAADATSLVPEIIISDNATISPDVGEAQDFSSPVTYTVTAQDGITTAIYTVTVKGAKEVLLELKGANTNTTLLWDANTDINTWSNIDIDEGKLVAVNITEKEIQTLPASIGYLTDLEELNCENNSITELPISIGNLNKLYYLNLNYNQLASLPVTIGNLTNIEDLRITDNQLSSIPTTIGNLSNLMYLHFQRNQISSVPTEIGNLTSLRKLYFTSNQITSIPNEIGNLSDLFLLSFAENQLSTVPPTIGNLNNLETLYLFDNAITSLPFQLGNITSLLELRIEDNQLTTIPQEICDLESTGTTIIKDNGVSCE